MVKKWDLCHNEPLSLQKPTQALILGDKHMCGLHTSIFYAKFNSSSNADYLVALQ